MAERLYHLESWFPQLTPDRYEKIKEFSASYNCVAFAAGDENRRWEFGGGFWPMRAARIDHFIGLASAFYWIGYIPCSNGELEPGFEKIAIYADVHDEWQHAAHQCEDGWWESKCGDHESIRHQSPQNLEGDEYGQVVIYLKRKRVNVGTPTFTDAADIIARLDQFIDFSTVSGEGAILGQAILALSRELCAVADKNGTAQPDSPEPNVS